MNGWDAAAAATADLAAAGRRAAEAQATLRRALTAGTCLVGWGRGEPCGETARWAVTFGCAESERVWTDLYCGAHHRAYGWRPGDPRLECPSCRAFTGARVLAVRELDPDPGLIG